jgi:hypothetical protein
LRVELVPGYDDDIAQIVGVMAKACGYWLLESMPQLFDRALQFAFSSPQASCKRFTDSVVRRKMISVCPQLRERNRAS